MDKHLSEVFKVPLVLTAQPEGGYTVTSPVLPELVTEGDTLEEAVSNVRNSLAAVIEIYEDLGKPLPANLRQDPQSVSICFEGVVTRPSSYRPERKCAEPPCHSERSEEPAFRPWSKSRFLGR